jgi:hypothetical protein
MPGVVRVGETVRRPRGENWRFVRALLTHLRERGFEGAPTSLGSDEQGRRYSASSQVRFRRTCTRASLTKRLPLQRG